MKNTTAFRTVILLLTALLLLFSCSKSEDKRKVIEREYGEPDEIIKSEFAGIKYELYVYARRDINRVYEFQRSASGCGGSGQWYIYRFYYADMYYVLYSAPVIKHTPVISTPPGVKVSVIAEVIDVENMMTDVDLYYCADGEEEFKKVKMLIDEDNENIYSAEIPGETVTGDRIEYYIELSYFVEIYDKSHVLKLPDKGFYSVSVSEAVEKKAEGHTETTPEFISPSSLPEPGDVFDGTFPVSP